MLRVTASIPVELGVTLEQRARDEDRSASSVVRRWGPTSMLAKWCYIGVTDRRVVVLSLAR
jgi:hypothetical protein